MRILSISAGADTAGQGLALMHGFAAHSEHELRMVTAGDNYIHYPADMHWYRDREAVLAFARTADLILSHNSFDAARWVDAALSLPQVIWHHGTALRSDPTRGLERQRRYGAVGAVSTLDLALLAPAELAWLPVAVDAERLAAMRRRRRRPGPLRIAHAPTDRSIKSTEAFLAAFARLSGRHDLELVLLERLSHAECLAAKAEADIFFDQVRLGYGLNAVEAWAMGIPVVAGAAPPTLARMRQEFDTVLPFVETDEAGIEAALEQLVGDPALRAEYGRRGREHVHRFHAAERVVRRAEALFESALRLPRPPIEERLAGELVKVPGHHPGHFWKVTPGEAAALGYA